MVYPKLLIPTEVEIIKFDNKLFKISKSIIKFKRWTGKPIKERFGGKSLVCINNKPMFAEIALLNIFIAKKWQARWISTYG